MTKIVVIEVGTSSCCARATFLSLLAEEWPICTRRCGHQPPARSEPGAVLSNAVRPRPASAADRPAFFPRQIRGQCGVMSCFKDPWAAAALVVTGDTGAFGPWPFQVNEIFVPTDHTRGYGAFRNQNVRVFSQS